MTQEITTWQGVALIAGPSIAAISALASWASVWQARKLGREGTSPLLMIQKVIDPDTQTIGAIVTNAGGGAARAATVLLSHPPYRVEAALGHGFLYPGQSRRVWTGIPVTEVETDVLAFCRDRQSFPHYWSAMEEHRVFKTRFRRRPRYRRDLAEVFDEFHPNVEFEKLTRVKSQVTNDPPRGLITPPT